MLETALMCNTMYYHYSVTCEIFSISNVPLRTYWFGFDFVDI